MRRDGPQILRRMAGRLAALTIVLALAAGGLQAQEQGATTPPPAATPPVASPPAVTPPPAATPPAVTQTTPATGGAVVVSKGSGRGSAPDYATWERVAARAEAALANANAEDRVLESLRTQLVDWRAAFLAAQNTNSARLATLREQITALGPVPPEGETEAAEIAQRRQELADQLVRLQAPGITADEAYRRADGLIREVDRVLRERQANQLLQLWPSPVNPANWSEGLIYLRDAALRLWAEAAQRWTRGDGQRALFDNLPLILLLLVAAVGLMGFGRRILGRMTIRLPMPRTVRGRRVVGLAFSLLQVALPTLGAMALARALSLTGLAGPTGMSLITLLPGVVFTIAAANWLGNVVFTPEAETDASGIVVGERPTEGRFLARSIGIVLGIESVRQTVAVDLGASDTVNAVLGFPVLAAMAVLIFRMGQLLRLHVKAVAGGDETPSFAIRVLSLLSRGVKVTGIAGVVLGAVGYIAAATALVYPSVISLGLVAVLFVAQRLVADLYGLVIRSEAPDQEGLVPVLIGFAMTVASIPLFALIWGARQADISELWQRFLEGFQLGATRVSPTDFLIFAVIFAVGYAVTRLVQGALKGSVLPRTSLDQGGQNAVVSGVGYLGIFLAALIAINSAGIDLSGLAIVAGALSVGIGFGLQNIVSNFVSGIILLIERPVSEGDWIEVGNVQGTVRSISVRSTRIQTFDRSDVIVPNADLVTQRVTNWTRYNLSGRLIVPVSVVLGTDTRHVERVLREIAEEQPLAILNPPPIIAFMGFGTEWMNFEIRMILRDVNFSLSVRSEINHRIVERFAAEGIEMPGAKKIEAEAAAGVLLAAEVATMPADAEVARKPRRNRRETTTRSPRSNEDEA